MRVLGKIFFIFLFFFFALTNFASASDDTYSQISISNAQDELHCDICTALDSESYIIVPTNSNDSNGMNGNVTLKNFSIPDFKSFFAEKYINYNFDKIAFIFKTEIYPNAP